MAGDKLIELTDANFKDQVRGDTPLLVDFWAEWCGPCKAMGPVLDDLATEFEGKVRFGKLNIDSNPGTAGEHGVRAIPTFLIFKNGEIVGQATGARPKDALKQMIEQALGG